MNGLTTDPNDPRLGHGSDSEPGPQNETYLVLSEEERAKGFVRPYRAVYVHVGPPGPRYPLRDLTPEEEAYGGDYVKYEPYPESEYPSIGRYWTLDQLAAADRGGCGAETRMGRAIAETYARSPGFYGNTYCVGCQMHRPVGSGGEFVWLDDGTRVGT